MTCDCDHERGLFTWFDDDGHRAHGVAFPDKSVAMLWDRSTWKPEERLTGEHISLYACVDDVLHANGGRLHWDVWIGIDGGDR